MATDTSSQSIKATDPSSGNNNTPKYPNPIPPPPIDQTFASLAAAATYLHGFAANHGFELSILDSRQPTSIKYKCTLGDHRHTTKAKSQALTQSTLTENQSPTACPLKTCPFKIISRRNRRDHSSFYLTFQEEPHSHHNHGPREGPPKKIVFIPSLHQPQTTTSTSFPTSTLQLPPTLSSAIPELSLLTHQYQLLLQEMQSLPPPNQAYLLSSFLRDVEFAKGIASSTTLAPIQPRRTAHPALPSTSAEGSAETTLSKGKSSMTDIPRTPNLSSPAASQPPMSIPNLQVSPSVHQDIIEFTIRSIKSPSPDSSTIINTKTHNLTPPTLPKKATSPVHTVVKKKTNTEDHISTHSPSHQDTEELIGPIPPAEIANSHADSGASNENHPTQNRSSPLPELNLDITMEAPPVEAERSKNEHQTVSGSGVNENYSTENRSSPLPEFEFDSMQAPQVEDEPLANDEQAVSGVLPLPDQAKVPKGRSRKGKHSKVEEKPAPVQNHRTRKGKKKAANPKVSKSKPTTSKATTNPDLPKLPKGYGYVKVLTEDDENAEHQDGSEEGQAVAVGRGRKRKGCHIPPPKVSKRRQVAAVQEPSAESEMPSETAAEAEVTSAASPKMPSPSAESTAAQANVSLSRGETPQPKTEYQPIKPHALLEKKKYHKPFTPEEMDEARQIECVVLKKWPFLGDIPRFLFPFIKNAVDVPKDGLCAFSSIAVSLGLTPNQAPTIRSVLFQHLQCKFDWYAENLPKFAVDFDIKDIERILKSTATTAERSDWFPMPCGGYIIANTYNRPVIYYSPSDASSNLILPCFSEYCPSLKGNPCYQPIVMGFINNEHFISLDLLFNSDLPIPFLHPDWLEIRDERARGWYDLYTPNIVVYLGLRWQREWNKKGKALIHPVRL